jgi:3-carboxy-cis,cis-muconate cycloisomerase
MTISATDSGILGPLFADPLVAATFEDAARVRAMVAVEAALARVQANLGLIPTFAAECIARAADDFAPDLGAIGADTERSGVPTIALVAQLRNAAGEEAAPFVHWGVTSQDIVDTAFVLQARDLADAFAARIAALTETLMVLADRHRATIMVARTRSQQALPTTFGLKVAGWLSPLARHHERLREMWGRVFAVQLGGAAGTLAALGDRGPDVAQALAAELGLAAPDTPWHAQRDRIAELADWLSLVTGSLGKIGQDLVLLAQTEVAEVTEQDDGKRGGSSTMPQKSNPVAAETLVGLARSNAALVSTAHQALIQEHERGGPGWQLEWMTLPPMFAHCGAALNHAGALIERLTVDTGRIAANLEASNGLILAEAATFALADHMTRPEAQALVKDACADVARTGSHLVDVLRDRTKAPVDWDALRMPANYVGAADRFVDQAIATARAAVAATRS